MSASSPSSLSSLEKSNMLTSSKAGIFRSNVSSMLVFSPTTLTSFVLAALTVLVLYVVPVGKVAKEESTSAYVECYKDECIHVKACPEILKISGFMNGINNPELIKRLNDRVPQTFG
ncbi:hypothetical protein Tco_0311242 [Tanacetum coccineum]